MKLGWKSIDAIVQTSGYSKAELMLILRAESIPHRAGRMRRVYVSLASEMRLLAAIRRREALNPSLQAGRSLASRRFVYFARQGSLVKIGMSVNPRERARKMQVGATEEIELLCAIPGGADVERNLHAAFEAYRVRGEWFRLEGHLADYIATMAAQSSRESSHETQSDAALREALERVSALQSNGCADEQGDHFG